MKEEAYSVKIAVTSVKKEDRCSPSSAQIQVFFFYYDLISAFWTPPFYVPASPKNFIPENAHKKRRRRYSVFSLFYSAILIISHNTRPVSGGLGRIRSGWVGTVRINPNQSGFVRLFFSLHYIFYFNCMQSEKGMKIAWKQHVISCLHFFAIVIITHNTFIISYNFV